MVLPAREVADTIGPIVERLRTLDPLIDQILVVDASSRDGTADVAAAAGAEVHQESELVPELGQALGKGDAMWRALATARGELVAYLDSDTSDFSPHFAIGLLGPLLREPDVEFVKGFFRRPYRRADGAELPADGGRVTELAARPLLSAFYPELAGFVQPLAGEVAARRSLLDRIPFSTGYAVETAMLLDARDALGGIDRMAQVDLDVRLNRHQPLRARPDGLRGAAGRARAPPRRGPPARRPRAAAPDRRRRARAGRGGQAAAVCHAPRSRVVALRCVYTDLDGTLLGQGASLFRTAEGDFTLLAARALEACHRAGVEVVIKSGRRRAQVMEDARLIGQSSYIFEVGAAMVLDGEATFLTGELQPRDGESVHDQIAATGAPELLLREYHGRLDTTRPSTSAARSRTCSGGCGRARGERAAGARGHSALRLVDNGEIGPGTHTFHLIPAVVSKARAVAAHMRARATRARSASESATRRRTSTWPRSWGGCSWWRTRSRATLGQSECRAHRGRDERGLLRGNCSLIGGKLVTQVTIAVYPVQSGSRRSHRTQEDKMHLSDAHHSRKMVAGACMVVAPFVLLVAMVIHPASDMDEAAQVATIADNLDGWYVAHLLALVAIVSWCQPCSA